MRGQDRTTTLHAGVRVLPEATLLYELYRDRTEALHLRIETLKKSPPLPILLYNTTGPCESLMLDGALVLALSRLAGGPYECRTASAEILRFVLD